MKIEIVSSLLVHEGKEVEITVETSEVYKMNTYRYTLSREAWERLDLAEGEISREDMKALIDRRVDKMVEEGLLEEVRGLLASGISREATALQAIGYKEFLGVADGTATVEEAVAEVKLRSRQYAKRQLTWLRRNEAIHWIEWKKERDFERALQLSTEILRSAGVC